MNTQAKVTLVVLLATVLASHVHAQVVPLAGHTTLTWDLYDETGNNIAGYQLDWQSGLTSGIVIIPLGQVMSVVTIPRPNPPLACCNELPGPPPGCQCEDIRETHYWPLAVSPIREVIEPLPEGAEITFWLRACLDFTNASTCSARSNAVVATWPRVCNPLDVDFITCVSPPPTASGLRAE